MSDAIAGGLIGATAALVGAFGVQMLIGRQAATRRRRELAAQFLASLDIVYFHTSHARRATTQDEVVARVIGALNAQDRMTSLGNELAFMCDRDIATDIRQSIDKLIALVASADRNITSNDDWDKAAEGYVELIVELADTLHDEFGRS